MTLFVKVFDSSVKKLQAFDYYVNLNAATISKVSFKDCRITLNSGINIKYICVQNVMDCQNYLMGCQVEWLELDNNSQFDNSVVEWMKTRVRSSYKDSNEQKSVKFIVIQEIEIE